MQKQLKLPAMKPCLRAVIWIVLVTGAAWHCPYACAQAGKAPGSPPTVETFFNRFTRSPKKDSLPALVHFREAGSGPVYLAARRHHSPVLAKAAKNNPGSLIRAALRQDQVLTGGGRLPLYRADLPGTAGNHKPPAGTDGDKSRAQNEPPTLEEYIRGRGLKKKP